MVERYNHIWKTAFGLLVIGVDSMADILRLIVTPISHIPLNPLLALPLSRLVRRTLGMDPIEPPGARLRPMVKSTALGPARQASAYHGLEVALIAVECLIPGIVLSQYLL